MKQVHSNWLKLNHFTLLSPNFKYVSWTTKCTIFALLILQMNSMNTEDSWTLVISIMLIHTDHHQSTPGTVHKGSFTRTVNVTVDVTYK